MDPLSSKEIGERIREGRTRLGLSQEQAGLRVGVKRVMFNRYEKGRVVPPRRRLLKMQQELGLTLEEGALGVVRRVPDAKSLNEPIQLTLPFGAAIALDITIARKPPVRIEVELNVKSIHLLH